MPSLRNFLLNTTYEVDANAEEEKLRASEPLLLHANEHIVLSLKEGRDGRDKSYFTSHRIIIKDGKGLVGTKKRKHYKSLPYTSIQGFAVTTAGAVIDYDTELEVWGSAGSHEFTLSKKQVNLFDLQQFLSRVVLIEGSEQQNQGKLDDADEIPQQEASSGWISKFGTFVTGDAAASDPAKVEARFKKTTPVLLDSEHVELAFQTGRDYLVLTDLRILRIDVQGLVGKRISFETILWSSISASSITTSSGMFDRDMEMTLHTNMEPHDKRNLTKIEMDFRKGKADIFALQKIIVNHILGDGGCGGNDDKSGNLVASNNPANVGSGWSWANIFDRDASRPIDPHVMDRNLRTNPPILQNSERVELAFKGIRDMIVFTTKRLLIIDRKGIRGKQVEYTSLPYKSMIAFSIETAWAIADMNTEVRIWTDMNVIATTVGHEPGMSFFELEFNKKLVDLAGLKKYLSQRILKTAAASSTDAVPPPPPSLEPNNQSTMADFVSYFSNNQRSIDPKAIDQELHQHTPLLLDDERVIMAFKAGRDLTLFTNLRVMIVDIQGLMGKRVSYRSIPFTSILAFAVESAGSWDFDSKLDLYTGNLWNMGKIDMDFRKGQVDILSIHRFLSAMTIGDAQEQASYLDSHGASLNFKSKGGLGAFINWLGNNSTEQNASKIDEQLHLDPPLLMVTERVEKAYKTGRDMFVYTSHRVMLIDVQGIRGKKVEYLSVPHQFIHGFNVETAGHLDRDADVKLINDIPRKAAIHQEILVKRGDVMELQQYLTEKLVIVDDCSKHTETKIKIGKENTTPCLSASRRHGTPRGASKAKTEPDENLHSEMLRGLSEDTTEQWA